MLQVSIYRYNPEADSAPRMEDFTVETGGRDLMVLDVLEMIKADQDTSVTYRRSCREGVCGSDGLNINGKKRMNTQEIAKIRLCFIVDYFLETKVFSGQFFRCFVGEKNGIKCTFCNSTNIWFQFLIG